MKTPLSVSDRVGTDVDKLADEAETLLPHLREGASIHDAAMIIAFRECKIVNRDSAKIYAAIVVELFRRQRAEKAFQPSVPFPSASVESGYSFVAHSGAALAAIESKAPVFEIVQPKGNNNQPNWEQGEFIFRL
jgi:hypothetical protein